MLKNFYLCDVLSMLLLLLALRGVDVLDGTFDAVKFFLNTFSISSLSKVKAASSDAIFLFKSFRIRVSRRLILAISSFSLRTVSTSS